MTVRRAQLVGSLLAFVAFAVVVQQVMTDGRLVDLDRDLADRYANHQLGQVFPTSDLVGHGHLQALSRAITPLGDVRVLLVAVAIVAYLLHRRGRRREWVYLTTVAVGGVLIDLVVRIVIGHVRPALPSPYHLISRWGVPSGHALDAAACYGAFLVVAWPHLSRPLKVLAAIATVLLVVGISYSRIVLLAHYFSDVLAGMTLGLAWLLLVTAAFSLPGRDRLP